MDYQKVTIKYSGQTRIFNLNIIDSFSTLQSVISSNFILLPPNYLISVEDQLLTEQRFNLIKQTKFNDFEFQIKRQEVNQDIESLISDVSRIQIMDENQLREQSIKYCEKQKPLEEKDRKFFKQMQQDIISNSKINEKQTILNEDVQCNGCFAFPIKGVIYKCLICLDYDLCSECQKSKHHFHPLLKIKEKDEYPIKLKVVFSKQSKIKMQKLAQLDKINQQRVKKAKYHKEVKQYSIIDPSQLKATKVCAGNFLSEIIGRSY